MRIESFWAKGFRSLRDVRLEGLGPFCVFYGPNGSGKSNILAGIRVLLEICRLEHHLHPPGAACSELIRAVLENQVIESRDRYARSDDRTIVLGARFTNGTDAAPVLSSGPVRLVDLTVEYTLEWIVDRDPSLVLTQLESEGRDLRTSVPPDHHAHLRRLLQETLPQRAYTLVGATRVLGRETDSPTQMSVLGTTGRRSGSAGATSLTNLVPFFHGSAGVTGSMQPLAASQNPMVRVLEGAVDPPPSFAATQVSPAGSVRSDVAAGDHVIGYLRRGEVAHAFFEAYSGESTAMRRRYERLSEFLKGEPLKRPPFRPARDHDSGAVELKEILKDPNPDGTEISLDLAGLGIAQIYWILAHAMLSGARAVAIEEPEAHLHAPTTGLQLRELLKRLVVEQHIDQLFIATHSNLFDLDPEIYWDVSLAGGETHVERKGVQEIDAQHLYEPGPAKHALAQLLRYAPNDEVVFRRPHGALVTAEEMLRLLEEDDEVAVEFLRTLHGAALRVVRLDARREGGAK
jgi:hypothetical protein